MMKLKLIDDWKKAYKFSSVQLAAFAAIIATIIAANQSLALSLIAMLPEGPMRTVAAALVGALVFVVPALARVIEKCKSDGSAS
jgi:hypothetical protein